MTHRRVSDIERLLVDLDDVLQGDAAVFRGGIMSGGEGAGIGDLLDERHIVRIMAWYDHRLGAHVDRRPALSIWMGWHFQSVLPPLMAANILLDRCPHLDLDEVTFVLSPEHKAVRLGLGPRVDLVSPLTGPSRFEPLVRAYLAPLIGHAAVRTGLTSRVLWSNAGHVFGRLVDKLETCFGSRPGVGAARDLLAMRTWPDGSPNMLYSPVKCVEGQRLRRVCCMRYLFPDGRICAVCPMRLNRPARLTAHA